MSKMRLQVLLFLMMIGTALLTSLHVMASSEEEETETAKPEADKPKASLPLVPFNDNKKYKGSENSNSSNPLPLQTKDKDTGKKTGSTSSKFEGYAIVIDPYVRELAETGEANYIIITLYTQGFINRSTYQQFIKAEAENLDLFTAMLQELVNRILSTDLKTEIILSITLALKDNLKDKEMKYHDGQDLQYAPGGVPKEKTPPIAPVKEDKEKNLKNNDQGYNKDVPIPSKKGKESESDVPIIHQPQLTKILKKNEPAEQLEETATYEGTEGTSNGTSEPPTTTIPSVSGVEQAGEPPEVTLAPEKENDDE